MTSVTEIDRLVVSDDAVAARLWPRLGPRVRRTYLEDRDGWVTLRRKVEAGATLPPATLAAEQRVFSGWARAFRAAAAGQATPGTKVARRSPRPAAGAHAAKAAAAPAPRAHAAAAAVIPASRVALAAPALATAAQVKGSGGTAVAGGLVLAGLIAVAARRKRA